GIRDFHVTGVQTCALPIFFVLLILLTQLSARYTQQQTYHQESKSIWCGDGYLRYFKRQVVKVNVGDGLCPTHNDHPNVLKRDVNFKHISTCATRPRRAKSGLITTEIKGYPPCTAEQLIATTAVGKHGDPGNRLVNRNSKPPHPLSEPSKGGVRE